MKQGWDKVEVIDLTTENREKEHSTLGIISVVMAFILGAYKFGVEIISKFLADLNTTFTSLLSTPVFLWMVVALLLGFIGVTDKNNKRLFGILGFFLNMLHLFSGVLFLFLKYYKVW